MQDAWRAYLELALGLTEASRRRAERVARDLLGKGGATAAQAQSMVEDLLATSRANREDLTRLVRAEVERALGRVGLASSEEVGRLNTRLAELESRLAEAEREVRAGRVAEQPRPPKKAQPKKAAAKKAQPSTTAAAAPAEEATTRAARRTSAGPAGGDAPDSGRSA